MTTRPEPNGDLDCRPRSLNSLIIKFLADELEVGVKNEIIFSAVPAHGFLNLVFPIVEFHLAARAAFDRKAATNFALSSSVTARPLHAGAWDKPTRKAAASNIRMCIGDTSC
jgi:hypothetical protein